MSRAGRQQPTDSLALAMASEQVRGQFSVVVLSWPHCEMTSLMSPAPLRSKHLPMLVPTVNMHVHSINSKHSPFLLAAFTAPCTYYGIHISYGGALQGSLFERSEAVCTADVSTVHSQASIGEGGCDTVQSSIAGPRDAVHQHVAGSLAAIV